MGKWPQPCCCSAIEPSRSPIGSPSSPREPPPRPSPSSRPSSIACNARPIPPVPSPGYPAIVEEDVAEDALVAVPFLPDHLHFLAEDFLAEGLRCLRAERLLALLCVDVQEADLVRFLVEEIVDRVAVGHLDDLAGEGLWGSSARSVVQKTSRQSVARLFMRASCPVIVRRAKVWEQEETAGSPVLSASTRVIQLEK
jgi:hypothetical protein